MSGSDPVSVVAAGLHQPDDMAYRDGVILLGEHTQGRIVTLGQPPDGQLQRLPVTVPLVEGLAFGPGSTIYAVDQLNDRVLAIEPPDRVRIFLQLVPVAGQEGADGIATGPQGLIVPDSPRGTVLVVDQEGRIVRQAGGFGRPAGAWGLPDGSILIADENAAAVFQLALDGGRTRLAGGIPLADDVVAGFGGIYAISISGGTLVEVGGGQARTIARGFKSPQGLAIDSAGNLLVTEYDAGRLDVVVRAFKLDAGGDPVALRQGQGVCIQLQRTGGYGAPVEIEQASGYTIRRQPGGSSEGEVVPAPCSQETCALKVVARSGDRSDSVWLRYRTRRD